MHLFTPHGRPIYCAGVSSVPMLQIRNPRLPDPSSLAQVTWSNERAQKADGLSPGFHSTRHRRIYELKERGSTCGGQHPSPAAQRRAGRLPRAPAVFSAVRPKIGPCPSLSGCWLASHLKRKPSRCKVIGHTPHALQPPQACSHILCFLFPTIGKGLSLDVINLFFFLPP